MDLKNNYHTHTARCGHANGTDEEYVLNAIKAGIKELGFSDHIPFPNISHPGVRMEYHELDDYINSITELREKYKDQIKIYIGFETEYFEKFHDYYKYILTKVDYLILGQHFEEDENGYLYVGFAKDDQKVVKKYFDIVIKAMETGMFKYVAHPDIIMRSYTIRDEFMEKQIRRLCEASERLRIPLEINLEGMNRKVRMGEPLGEVFYPFPSFWKIVGEYNIDVIIGADVHEPTDFLRDYDKYANNIIHMCNLHLIDRINIKED